MSRKLPVTVSRPNGSFLRERPFGTQAATGRDVPILFRNRLEI